MMNHNHFRWYDLVKERHNDLAREAQKASQLKQIRRIQRKQAANQGEVHTVPEPVTVHSLRLVKVLVEPK